MKHTLDKNGTCHSLDSVDAEVAHCSQEITLEDQLEVCIAKGEEFEINNLKRKRVGGLVGS